MSRCCGNCFWGFTVEDEEQLEGYSDDDPNRPQAGDCCIGQQRDEHYCCSEHSYIEGMEEYENYVLYDEEYMGPGYLLISKMDGEVDRFIKISIYGENGFPSFSLRAYARGCVDKPDEEYRKVSFDVKKGEPLYDVVYELGLALDGKITTCCKSVQGKNYLEVTFDEDTISLVATKDVYGVKHSTDFVDIFIGDNDSCEKYFQFSKFYNSLSTISVGKSKEEDIKQLLLTR